MIYEIKNDYLTVAISSIGAELMSIKTNKDSHEYLWQGDKAYWGGRAYNLFPICGRITQGIYTYKGTTYEGLKSPHGFLRNTELKANVVTDDHIIFVLKSKNHEDILKCYPFDFIYRISYKLEFNTIKMRIKVSNSDDKEMIFSIVGHPGFNTPMDNEAFEDDYIEFSDPSNVKQVYMTDAVFTTNKRSNYPFVDGNKIPLKHDLFDRDAIVLENPGNEVVLKSKKSKREVCVAFPKEMKYLGIWHTVKKEAPFVAIEPWGSLPTYDGIIDDLEKKPDMVKLPAGKTYELEWSISIK